MAVVLAMPYLGAWLDRTDRLAAVRAGIAIQAAGVVVAGALLGLADPASWLVPAVALAGIGASLGAAIMNVALSFDWVPAAFPAGSLASINSRLKQIDLGTEVLAPVAAGFVMGLSGSPVRGILIVMAANVLSFALEYVFLASAYRKAETLRSPRKPRASARPGLLRELRLHAGVFLRQRAALAMVAFSLLWLTVLTPHGEMITAFLKSEWRLADHELGLLRAAGAIVGILPTFFYERMARALGAGLAGALFITEQSFFLLIACACLHLSEAWRWLFVAALLLSRIGLYGFTLAETQVCQETIDEDVRGAVAGFAWSLNNLATLAVYILAFAAADTANFPMLAWISAGAVTLGAALVWRWLTLRR